MIDLLSVREASVWASEHLSKTVTTANISYLVNYGKITKIGENGTTKVSKKELQDYYKSFNGQREVSWKQKLGDDLNWALSFDNLKESETTKHVHRLHPYKGKFIPQLVEYFLDSHTDTFKQQQYFTQGDVILDPFCGSGTTLVQANELGMHGVGIDISAFNAHISNCKIGSYNINLLKTETNRITQAFQNFSENNHAQEFEQELLAELNTFNNKYFPVPEFKRKVQLKLINGNEYGESKATDFLPIYYSLIEKYKIELLQSSSDSFLEKWFTKHIRNEIDFIFEEIKKVTDIKTKKILSIILSRTMRSCRATTHADLATLKDPVTTTYYCSKHGKICKPLFSILKWWSTYSKDTITRLEYFTTIRTATFQKCLTGDSRTLNIVKALEIKNPSLYNVVNRQQIRGIFSSPPYVGLINYHEQHAYSYDLFGFERNDEMEIGPLFKGQGKAAKESYIDGVSSVLNNCKQYLIDDYDIFLVSNDKYCLYPTIAERAGMEIINQYKRPVLNRTEKDKGAYAEIIFHLKRK